MARTGDVSVVSFGACVSTHAIPNAVVYKEKERLGQVASPLENFEAEEWLVRLGVYTCIYM